MMAEIDTKCFADNLNQALEISKFGISIGSMNACVTDDFFVKINSTNAGDKKKIYSDFLSKIWNIDVEVASKVINQTTQLNRQGCDNDLSRQFTTNDRMLR